MVEIFCWLNLPSNRPMGGLGKIARRQRRPSPQCSTASSITATFSNEARALAHQNELAGSGGKVEKGKAHSWRKSAQVVVIFGGPPETRTPDPLIKSFLPRMTTATPYQETQRFSDAQHRRCRDVWGLLVTAYGRYTDARRYETR